MLNMHPTQRQKQRVREMDNTETRDVELLRLRLDAIRTENTRLEQELECLTRSESAQENEEKEEAIAQLSVMEELEQLKAAKEDTEIELKAIVADNQHIKHALHALAERLKAAPKEDETVELPTQAERSIDGETPSTIERTFVFEDGPNSWNERDTQRRLRFLFGDADTAIKFLRLAHDRWHQ